MSTYPKLYNFMYKANGRSGKITLVTTSPGTLCYLCPNPYYHFVLTSIPYHPQPRNIDANNTCFLCKKSPCTSAHILGACRISLNQGRYTFRHDSVLKVIFNYISAFLSSKGPSKPKRIHEVKFVKPGERFAKKNSKYEGLLHLSNDWISLVDLDNNCVSSSYSSAMRTDIVIYSNTLQRIIILELTCPCDENMSKWHSEKFQKYLALIEQIKYGGWIVDFFAVK